MRVWTYEVIDRDLLRDDILSAVGMSAGTAYTTMERAMEVAQHDWKERVREDIEENGPDFEWKTLVWEVDETNNGNVKAEPCGPDYITYRVYYIEIEGVPVEDTSNG